VNAVGVVVAKSCSIFDAYLQRSSFWFLRGDGLDVVYSPVRGWISAELFSLFLCAAFLANFSDRSERAWRPGWGVRYEQIDYSCVWLEIFQVLRYEEVRILFTDRADPCTSTRTYIPLSDLNRLSALSSACADSSAMSFTCYCAILSAAWASW
jgi:hypothetical protein